tara:strand:+ start:75 stop:443 length:369 start_codon:yes stop_codon:yes gene_type:complete
MTAYVVERRTVITEYGDVEADSLEEAWQLYEESPHDLLDYSDGDTESSVKIVEDVKELTPTGWDMKSCPACGKTDSLDVEEDVTTEGSYELFTVMSNCCAVQWMVEGLEMAAACDRAWKDVV